MSLYDEKVTFHKAVYDPTTGREDSLSWVEKEALDLKETESVGSAFEDLSRSVGWDLLTTWLKERVELYKSLLVKEKDFDKIRRFQEATLCYESVMQYVDQQVANGQYVKQKKETSSADEE